MKASLILAATSLLFPLMACLESTTPVPPRAPIDPKKLIGTWVLRSRQLIYHSATFRPDSQAILGCRGCDTIYRFRYAVTDSSIIFSSFDTRQFISNDVIEKLTFDTLIFRTLLDRPAPHNYYR